MAIGDSARINTNIAAFNALNSLKTVNRTLEKSQLKLATGVRINEVADDPAGFVITRRLTARSRGLSVAYDNVGTAKNVLAIAEGGLMNISNILITMKEKITQAASDTQGTNEREAIKSELGQLATEIDDIVTETLFNNINLLNGTYSAYYQTGEGVFNSTRFTINHSTNKGFVASDLSVDSTNVANQVLTAAAATVALGKVNDAIETVSTQMQQIGALVSRFSVKESTLTIAITNTESTRSRIEDADIAREQLNSTKLQILQQTATAQLAQANITPQNVLALFA